MSASRCRWMEGSFGFEAFESDDYTLESHRVRRGRRVLIFMLPTGSGAHTDGGSLR